MKELIRSRLPAFLAVVLVCSSVFSSEPVFAQDEAVAEVPADVAADTPPEVAAPASEVSADKPAETTPAFTADLIADIKVEGLRRVEEDAALSGIKIKKGSKLEDLKPTEALRQMWKSGFFDDVRIELEHTDKGVIVIFVVSEKPSIKEVRYLGNEAVNNEDVSGVVDIKPFTIVNTDQLKRNIEKIRNLYVEKGHYLAKVDYHLEKVEGSPHQVDVIFDISENAKVVVQHIALVGNEHLSDETIKTVLQTREGGEFSWLTQAGTYKEEFFETDLMRIQALYYDQGYVSVKIGKPSATISPDRRFIYLSVPIHEGERYSVGEVTFSGDVNLTDEEGKVIINDAILRKKLKSKPGGFFARTSLLEEIQILTDVYRDQGFAYANVTPNSAVRKDVTMVDLQMEVQRGERVHIDRIEIVGNTRTRDKVIRREMRIFEGDLYSGTGINRSRARIYQLGFFENVNITTSRGSGPNTMNITVEVKEKSTGTFQIGAGFSSVENFIATAQIAQNNFLGNGQLLQMSAQISFGLYARQMITFQFFEPYFLDSLWSLGINAYINQRYYRDFQRNAQGASPSFGYRLTPDLRLSLGYTLEWIEIVTGQAQQIALADLYRDGRNSALNLNLTYDTRDNRLFPTKGHYHSLVTEVSDAALGSEDGLEYKRMQAFLRYYYPLPLSLVLKLNASAGIVVGTDGRSVPISERFFPGGIYSIRGFEPRSLGPNLNVARANDPDASTSPFNIGGNKEVVFNLELEFPIIEQAGIKGVIFADAGNAYDDDEAFFYAGGNQQDIPNAYWLSNGELVDGGPPLGMFYSVGFGFRWFSPIGPLRFEWGIPLTKQHVYDRDIIFEFTIGNLF